MEKVKGFGDAINYLGDMLGWNDVDLHSLAWDIRERFGTWDAERCLSWDGLMIMAQEYRY